MRSINSLKTRPAFPMALLPHRQSIEPMNPEQPPKKKRIFYDRINEEESYPSDESSWDDASSNHSSIVAAGAAAVKHHATISKNSSNNTTAIRLLFSNNSGTANKASKRASKGIRELFQTSHAITRDDIPPKKKRESISTMFSSNYNRKQVHTKKKATYALHMTDSLNSLNTVL